jgi:hypothetical protein
MSFSQRGCLFWDQKAMSPNMDCFQGMTKPQGTIHKEDGVYEPLK